jgi:NADPH-dependent 2,4-dienoyl-CoA reductase/sulfur reductase-like enzyme
MRSIVIVGASQAGVSCAEELRVQGFDGAITLVGREPDLAYDRPWLSKAGLGLDRDQRPRVLWDPDWYPDHDVEVRLGRQAVGVDLGERVVALDDGSRCGFDGLVVATGADPVSPAAWSHHGSAPVTLRDLGDALSLGAALQHRPDVAIVGGGLIGAEVASAAAQLGCAVTVIEQAPALLTKALGRELGAACTQWHVAHGVTVRCGLSVESVTTTEMGSRVTLDDGSVINADLTILGLGARPATGWLQDSGLRVGGGLLCDSRCRASVSGVVGAGDVVRWDHPRYGLTRFEHWDNAAAQGAAAAKSLLRGDDADPYAPVPWFWTHQYGVNLQVVGWRTEVDELFVIDGDLASGDFTGLFRLGGEVHGAVAGNRSGFIRKLRRLLAETQTVDQVLARISR